MADDFTESVNRSADGMIRNHGSQAAAVARKTVERMEAQRDGVGERMWRAILMAIEKKQRPKEP
jgi:hypothetical protein